MARAASAELRQFARAGGLPVLVLETREAAAGRPVFYLSSGVHGDEAGAACGLLAWAEANIATLKKRPVLIFPCLNPQGLMLNTRADHRGLDINRRFHLQDDELCGPWHRVVGAREMSAALCLHEDYDGEGMYVYELSGRRETVGHDILGRCARIIPLDFRVKIDGRAASNGVIRPRKIPQDLPGLPEAIVLYRKGCPVTLTLETPSEFSLDLRIAAQAAFITAAVRTLT